MADLDKVWRKARDDLTVFTEAGNEDLFLWEHVVQPDKTQTLHRWRWTANRCCRF